MNSNLDWSKLEASLVVALIVGLETGDRVEVISGIDAEESRFVVDVSRIDDKSGDVFIPEEESEKGNFVVDRAELIAELEKGTVFVLKTGDKVEVISMVFAEENKFC